MTAAHALGVRHFISIQEGHHPDAKQAVGRPLPQRREEDRQIVRDEEGRDGNGDNIVQHQGPTGDEARDDQPLVRGVDVQLAVQSLSLFVQYLREERDSPNAA